MTREKWLLNSSEIVINSEIVNGIMKAMNPQQFNNIGYPRVMVDDSQQSITNNKNGKIVHNDKVGRCYK